VKVRGTVLAKDGVSVAIQEAGHEQGALFPPFLSAALRQEHQKATNASLREPLTNAPFIRAVCSAAKFCKSANAYRQMYDVRWGESLWNRSQITVTHGEGETNMAKLSQALI
jgi:hypothetical protein